MQFGGRLISAAEKDVLFDIEKIILLLTITAILFLSFSKYFVLISRTTPTL